MSDQTVVDLSNLPSMWPSGRGGYVAFSVSGLERIADHFFAPIFLEVDLRLLILRHPSLGVFTIVDQSNEEMPENIEIYLDSRIPLNSQTKDELTRFFSGVIDLHWSDEIYTG